MAEIVTRTDLDDPGTEEKAPGVHMHAPAPNRAQMRAGSSVIRAHVGTIEIAELEARVLKEAPGRVAGYDPGEKPQPGSTPWQSIEYVNERHSADGHAYRPGETIPEAEAARQGLLVPQTVAEPVRRRCARCEGRGTFSRTKPRGHAPDCTCMFCSACPACDGTGYEKEAV
jgi:hypothetical protein